VSEILSADLGVGRSRTAVEFPVIDRPLFYEYLVSVVDFGHEPLDRLIRTALTDVSVLLDPLRARGDAPTVKPSGACVGPCWAESFND
jgi:hypothetical protein